MFCNIRSFVNRRIKPVKVSFFILEIFFRHSWLLTWWWKVHLHVANVLLLRQMPVAIRWHLKVSPCGWLADLHGNTGSPDAAPGPTASAALPLPATSLILTDHLLWRSSIRLYLFYGLSLRPMPIDCCIDSKRPIARRCLGIGLLFQQLDWEGCGLWLSVHVGDRVFANWMNELICYGNEVKADRRPSGQQNQPSRKCRTVLSVDVRGSPSNVCWGLFFHLNVLSSNHNNMENSLSYFWNFECLKVETSS